MNKVDKANNIMARMKLFISLPLFLLFACSNFRQVPPAPIDPSGNAAILSQRSLQSEAVADAIGRFGLDLPATDTWTVDQLTVAAWTLNADIALARAELEAAGYANAVAQLPPNPALDLNLENVISNASNTPWVLGASLGLLLQPGGKLEIRRDRAQTQENVQQLQLGATVWSIGHGVRRTALVRELALETLALDRDEIGLRQAFLDWVQTRLALGAANNQDRLLAAESLQASQSRERADQLTATTASVQLAALLGVAPESLARINTPVSGTTAPEGLIENIARVRDLALVNRLDIRQALQEYALAEQDLKLAVAGQYPDLGLGPGYLYDQGDHKITLNTSIPLALHGSNQARINQALAERTVAARHFDQVQAAALGDIDSSYALYTSLSESLDAATAVETIARTAVQTARQRLAAGAADRGELLTAELLLLQRQRETMAVRHSLLNAISDLENAIQRPLFPPSALDFSIPATFTDNDL